MLCYVIVELRCDRPVAANAAATTFFLSFFLSNKWRFCGKRYGFLQRTPLPQNEEDKIKQKNQTKSHIKSVLEIVSKVICVNTPSSVVWPDSLRARCVLLYHFG